MLEPAYEVEEGRLARARGSEQRAELTLLQGEADAVQDIDVRVSLPVALPEVPHFQKSIHRDPRSARRPRAVTCPFPLSIS